MKSLKDRILNAKTKKEIDVLCQEYAKYDRISVNTKTKIEKVVKLRINELDGAVQNKKLKKSKKVKD